MGGWEQSELRAWLSSEVLPSVDPELRTCLVTVIKRTNNTGSTTSVDSVTSTPDRLWVPSVAEVCGTIAWEWGSDPGNTDAYNTVLSSEGTQYACFADMGVVSTEANQGLALAGAEGTSSWWLRSSSPSGGQSYRYVDEEGNPSRWASPLDQRGVCFGFCL